MNYNLNLRLLFFTLLTLIVSSTVAGQSDVSYEKLTNFLPLVRNHQSNIFYAGVNDQPLNQEILKLNWDLDNNETFEQLYQEVKDIAIDYRYYLIISKMCNDSYRKVHVDNDNTFNNIDYYYKSLFLNLAIEKGTNLNWYHKDSLKHEYTKQYILSTLNDYCFPEYNKFKEFADWNSIYCSGILNNLRFKLSKKERSELYWIIADANYRTKFIEEKNENSLSTTFRYLSLAINEDPNNWRAIRDRADNNKNQLKNYKAAINDYILWLKVIEAENKQRIIEHNKWLQKNKINAKNKKSFMATSPTFTRMADIAECYLNLDDYKNILVWCNKGIIAINQYREYNINSDELSSRYEGIIHYYKAISHFKLKENKTACVELASAINYGYDLEECKRLQNEIGCN